MWEMEHLWHQRLDLYCYVVALLKNQWCWNKGAAFKWEQKARLGFSLKLSKALQVFISWTCSPKLCIQVRGSAGQGSVLQFWQPCPSAGLACSIWLLFHGMPCTGMLRGSPWLTPQSTALRIVSHCCTWQGGAKIRFWYFWWRISLPGNASLSWFGHFHQGPVCGKGRESWSPPSATWESGNRATLSSIHHPAASAPGC